MIHPKVLTRLVLRGVTGGRMVSCEDQGVLGRLAVEAIVGVGK